jgi:predicted Zn-dependent protease
MNGRHFTRFSALVLTLSISMFSSCATSPLGRKQVMLLPDGQLNQMGLQSFEQLKSETPIERDPAINAYVRCVALPITQVSGDAAGVKEWEIVVFKEASANAFALPGGKIGVHTGILPVAKTPGQLAAVLAHEVGHVTARHGNERVSQGLLAQGLTTAAGLTMKDKSYAPIVLAGLGIGAQFGYLLPHSRNQESEADLIGLDYMSNAGFDPRESVALWENMRTASGGKGPPQFLSTHPSNETRIHDLQANIPAALPKYEAAKNAGRSPKCVKPAGI